MKKTKSQLDYYEKFKDPRWQKKRLQMFEKAGWKCQKCETETETLNLHHRHYKPKTDPWDYPDYWYMVLCNECHELEHDENILHIDSLIDILFELGFSSWDIEDLYYALETIKDRDDQKTKSFLIDVFRKIHGLHDLLPV